MDIILELEKLRLSHYTNEDDPYFNCPCSDQGTYSGQYDTNLSKDEQICTCVAHDHNKILDELLINLTINGVC